MLPTSGFCAWKERGSIIECIYIYIYILVIISLVIFILPPLISRRLPVSTTSKWKTRLRERMRRVSFRLTKGRGGATFNQGCVISDPSSTRSTFQRSLQRSCSEKFGLDVSISRIHICVCVKINFDFASPSRRRGVMQYYTRVKSKRGGSLHANDSRVHLSSFARIMSIVGVLHAK